MDVFASRSSKAFADSTRYRPCDEAQRINVFGRIVENIGVQICVATREADWILADKPLQGGVIVARPRVSTNHDINLPDDHPEFAERGIGGSQLPLTSS
jgi:hypothetical protein